MSVNMSDEVRDAIESARSSDVPTGQGWGSVKPRRHISFERVHYLLFNVLRDLPEGMTVRELREELEP